MNYTGFNEKAMEAIEDAKFDIHVNELSDWILDYWEEEDDWGVMEFSEPRQIGIKVRAVKR